MLVSLLTRKDDRQRRLLSNPTVTVSTKKVGNEVEIIVHDNGTGIPEHVKNKIFEPFFTTKPTGVGTGLGLSLTYEIIVNQHKGSLEVNSQAGDFTEFRIIITQTQLSNQCQNL
jgi:two-component system, NtrC family, sensor kinase